MADVRLIDANALSGKEEILYQHTASGKIVPWAAVQVCAINNAPTIDAAPVVHAGFKLTGYDEVWCTFGECQGCGHSNMVGSRYCNRCGAKLELIT